MRIAFRLVVLVALVAASRSSAAAPAGADLLGPGTHARSLEHGGIWRTYHLYVPAAYDRSRPAPLLLALHGGGGDGAAMISLTCGGFNSLADGDGFLVAYPDGVERHWNDGRKEVRYRTHREKIDDVGFLDALIDRLATDLNVDRTRVYVTGPSNGAMMTQRLALERSGKIAAIAPVIGSLPQALAESKPSRPIPVLIINGTDDTMMPWDGGDVHFGRLKLGKVLSTAGTVRFWARCNRSRAEPLVEQLPDVDPGDGTRVRRETHPAGPGGAEVVLYAVERGGHTWPQGRQYLREELIGKTSKDINGCEVIWQFLKRHSLPAEVAESATPAVRPPATRTAYHEPGPFRVKTLAFRDLRDAERGDRATPIKVHYPDAPGPFPLVVFSHGGMGTWDSHSAQARHVVSHGYVALCVEHVRSNNIRVGALMRGAGGGMKLMPALHRITTDPEAVLQRPRDVSFAIDQALRWNRTHGELKGRIDASRIAMIGHSFGAYTTLVVCGAQPILDYLTPKVGSGAGLAGDLSDPRVTFGLAMSPQSPGGTYFGKDSYGTIDRPLVCLSGSKDVQKDCHGGLMRAETRLEAFELLPPGDKVLLWLENADHMGFSDNPGSRFQFPSKPKADLQRISKAVMTLCCDLHLKQDPAARQRFGKEYVDSLCGGVVTRVTWREK